MSDIITMIDRTKDSTGVITELLYQQKTSEALESINSMLNDITELSVALSSMEVIAEDDKKRLVMVLGDALAAMEKKDYVLLADILQYDMIDLLDEYRSVIGK